MAKGKGADYLVDEIEERMDYFEAWLEKNSDDEQRSKVVNEKTAKEFIRDVFMDDGSLRSLIGGMDENSKTYKVLTDGNYVQKLMLENSGKKLDEAVAKMVESERSLSKALRRSSPKTKRAVINKVMKSTVAEKYGFRRVEQKNGRTTYRDKGRFVSAERLLSVTDKVISASAKSRKEVESLLQKDFMGRAKK